MVELFLNEGFAVHTGAQGNAADGLILKRHQGAGGTRLVLLRARDGALLALDPLSGMPPTGTGIAGGIPTKRVQPSTAETGAKVLSTASVARPRTVATPAEPMRIESPLPVHTNGVRSAIPAVAGAGVLVDMPGTPRSITTWATTEDAAQVFHLFALYDTKLIHFRYRRGDLKRIAEFTPSSGIACAAAGVQRSR